MITDIETKFQGKIDILKSKIAIYEAANENLRMIKKDRLKSSYKCEIVERNITHAIKLNQELMFRIDQMKSKMASQSDRTNHIRFSKRYSYCEYILIILKIFMFV